MLNGIIEFSIKNKLIIGLFIVGLIGYGSYETSKLPIDAVPDITNNQIQIITVAPSFGATDIERLITFPVEQANSNIDGIQEMRSFSRFGLSLVTIVFDDNTDIFLARQQVAERLQKLQSEIPAEVGVPEMGPITTGLGEIYQYVIRPAEGYENKYTATELRTIQDWMVRRQLLGVDGVAEVSSFGGYLKQYEVAVDPGRLDAAVLSIDDVFTALEKNNQNTGGAYIERGPSNLFIRSEGLIGTQEDIESIPVARNKDGNPVLIRDIAEVRLGHATRYGAMCYQDQGEVSGAVVMMLKGANSSEVIKNVKERIAEIQKSLPEGVLIEPFLDRTKMVNNAMSTVETNLLEGALIVLFVLIIFLGNIRAGLLVASVIPLAMLFAIIMMNLFGVAGNLMSLGALDFGLIVDGAVFIVEAVLHQLAHNKNFRNIARLTQSQMDEEVAGSSKKMARSVVFGQLIILIVYLPTFTLSGIEGKMFIPMAQTVSFALLGAFLLSITYVPMMSTLVMSKKITHQKSISDRIMEQIEKRFQRALEKVLNHQRITLTVTLLLFALSVFVLSRMGGEFIPALEEGDFAVETRVLTGSSLATTVEYTQKASAILIDRFPEVEKVVTKIGSSEIPTDPMPMEAADMMIILKDKSEWTSAKNFPELAEKMGKAMEEVPGITTGFQFPVQMRFNELMTGARQDVVCKIFGEDLDTLAANAEKLAKIIESVEGVEDLYVEPVTGMPQLVIDYDRQAIARYNLTISDVNRIVNTALAGQAAGTVFEGEKRFDLVVRMKGELRNSADAIRDLLIPLPTGEQIQLRSIAQVEIQNGPNQIQRENARRRIIIGFNVRNRDVQSLVRELQDKAETSLRLPAGYSITYGGAFENLNAAKARLAIAVPIALILIYLLLYFTFNSLKQGLLIYTAIPLSAIGGIFFLAARGLPFSISAGVGFIALFGVAVLNGIVLVAEFNRLKSEGMTDKRNIVLTATRLRLRPVLMTAFVASLGFLPMALSNGAGAEVQRPLATVVIGGLLFATFLTLFVLPILYIFSEKIGRKKDMKIQPIATAILLLVSVSGFSQTISLEAATDSALQNSHLLKEKRLQEKYTSQYNKAYVAPVELSGEYGQVNSFYTDSKLSVSQSFYSPGVYRSQKNLMQSQLSKDVLATNLTAREVKRAVALSYYHVLTLVEKERLLERNDSIIALYKQKMQLMFDLGEISILDLSNARSMQAQSSIELQRVREEHEIALLGFNLILNTQAFYSPLQRDLRFTPGIQPDSSALEKNPLLNYYKSSIALARSKLQVEKSRGLPEISLGYTNQSFIGLGPNDVMYNAGYRFHSANITMSIPIFRSYLKGQIKAAEIDLLIADNQYSRSMTELRYQIECLQSRLKSDQEVLRTYAEIQLPAAEDILRATQQKIERGEITFVEWTIMQSQTQQIFNEYIQAVETFNADAIETEFLLSNP